MNVQSLHDKFVYHLQEMYYIENRLVGVLDELARDVSTDELERGLNEHREQTEIHVSRLNEIFNELDEPPEERQSPVFDALLEERELFFDEAREDQDMRDLHDLGAAMKTEYLEISGYENLIMLARKLDLSRDIRSRLENNRDEEEETRKQLKALAEDSPVRQLFARLAG